MFPSFTYPAFDGSMQKLMKPQDSACPDKDLGCVGSKYDRELTKIRNQAPACLPIGMDAYPLMGCQNGHVIQAAPSPANQTAAGLPSATPGIATIAARARPLRELE